MSAAPWDAAASSTLQQANRLLAAGSIAWFDAPGWPFGDDLFVGFDRLIRQSLGPSAAAAAWPGGSQSGSAAPAWRAAPWPRSEGAVAKLAAAAMPGVVPAAGRSGTPALPVPAPQQAWPPSARGASAGRPAATLAGRGTPYATPYAASVAASSAAADGRPHAPALGRVAAATTALDRRPIAASLSAAQAPGSLPPAARAGAVATAGAEPAPRSVVAPAGAPPARGASILDWPLSPGRSPAAPLAAAAWPDAAPDGAAAADRNLAGVRGAAAQAWPQPTRLVAGIPALQGLLRAVVADSRERHALPTEAAEGSVSSAPAAVTTTPATTPQALPHLDALAEDMLVDRLADRLQERLREDALRQLGFSGGLT